MKARHTPACFFTVLVAMTGASGAAFAQPMVEYDARSGLLPHVGGCWTFVNDPGQPTPVIVDQTLHQGPTTFSTDQRWERTDAPIDFDAAFEIQFEMKVVSSTFQGGPGEIQRAGYNVQVVDSMSRIAQIWLGGHRLCLSNDNPSRPGPGAPAMDFDSTDGFHTYAIGVSAGQVRLSIDGVPRLTTPVGGAQPGFPANRVIFGDATLAGSSETFLRYVRYTGVPCTVDCDCSRALDIFDFLCFQNRFAAADPYACDCDTGGGPGVCDIFDFLCFQNAFAAGCP